MAAAYTHPALHFWRQRVQAWYPDYLRRPYMQPAVFMNRTRHQTVQYAGQDVYVPEPPVSNLPRQPRGAARPALPPLLQSDVRDDSCQIKVLRCLQEMPGYDKEVMFIISQFDFGHYLNQPAYAAAANCLPRPIDLKAFQKHQGDFDLLIIHRVYGILVGEIKAVGDQLSSMSQQQQEQTIGKRVRQAMQQLQKAVDVLRHIVSDQATPPRILTTLMLPNVSTAQLQSLLANDQPLCADLRQCLGIAPTEDPSLLCVTSDTLTKAGPWWQQRMTGAGTDSAMNDQLYLDLISRFAGPASTVKVACTSMPRLHLDMRTEGEGVAETGWSFTQLVLSPRQLAVLNSPDRLVFLTGPPGVGKSVVLAMKGQDWLQRGEHVQVVSTWSDSLAASHMILSQMQQTAGPAATGRLHLHTFDTLGFDLQFRDPSDVERAVTTLRASSHNGQLFIIADEVCRKFDAVCQELHRHLAAGLHVWAADIERGKRPSLLTEVVLDEALRTPPTVTREVQQATFYFGQGGQVGDVYRYSEPPCPPPCDGLPVRVIDHSGQGHSAGDAQDCERCGTEVGGELHSLHVGAGSSTSGAPPLRYSGVFLLTTSFSHFTDTVISPSGEVTLQASGIVRGLRQVGVPVTVVTPRDERALVDMATRRGADHVIATSFSEVHGLERPVVVCVEREGDALGRLFCMSRSSALLIWVKG